MSGGICMWCKIMPLESAENYKFVVVLSRYENSILLSRHCERATWETQGGHIEEGETPMEAAKRELFEESGAAYYQIKPLFDYEAGDEGGSAAGMVFYADIQSLSQLPESEMAETARFKNLPENLTYPGITPLLFQKAEEMGLFKEIKI